MRLLRWFALSLCLPLVLCAGGVWAGEDESAKEADPHAAVLAAALEVLHTRLEAGMERAETLKEMGRLEEALEAYTHLEILFEREMKRITELLARLDSDLEEVHLPKQPEVIRDPKVASPPLPKSPDERMQQAVGKALAWLAAHQSSSGGWEAAGFGRWCRRLQAETVIDGQGKADYDVGVTGLAVRAFLHMGHKQTGDDAYAKVVANGLRYLSNAQDIEGCFGPRTSQHWVYNHGIATLAMVEAYLHTRDEHIWEQAQLGLRFICEARNPYFAWRYGNRPGDNDTSVTAWMIQALAVARLANQEAETAGRETPFEIDEGAFDGARAWIDKMTDPEFGRTGYIQRGGSVARPQALIDRFPAERSEAMTAAGLVIRVLVGEDPKASEVYAKGVKLLEAHRPQWTDRGHIDMYYWHYGTLAMIHRGGEAWQGWRRALYQAVVPAQRHDDDPCAYDGSWDPVGPWGPEGGRVYATALMAITLADTLRHGPPFAK